MNYQAFYWKILSNFPLAIFKESLQKCPSLTLIKSIFKNFDLLKNKNHKTELIEDIFKYLKILKKLIAR